MPAYRHFAPSLHARTNRPVGVGYIHARHKNALVGLHLALWTNNGYIPPKSLQGEAFEFDGCALTAPEQHSVSLRHGNIHRDMRTFNNLRKSIAMHQTAAIRVLYLRCGHNPIKWSPYGGTIQSFARPPQLRLEVVDLYPLRPGQRSVILRQSAIHRGHGLSVFGFGGADVSAVVPVL